MAEGEEDGESRRERAEAEVRERGGVQAPQEMTDGPVEEVAAARGGAPPPLQEDGERAHLAEAEERVGGARMTDGSQGMEVTPPERGGAREADPPPLEGGAPRKKTAAAVGVKGVQDQGVKERVGAVSNLPEIRVGDNRVLLEDILEDLPEIKDGVNRALLEDTLAVHQVEIRDGDSKALQEAILEDLPEIKVGDNKALPEDTLADLLETKDGDSKALPAEIKIKDGAETMGTREAFPSPLE